MSQPATISFKVRRNDEHRRFTMDAPISFAALVTQIRNIFSVQPSAIVLKYKDNEGDLVSISSDVELTEAIRICIGHFGLIRLELTCQPAPQKPVVPAAKTAATPKAAPAPGLTPAKAAAAPGTTASASTATTATTATAATTAALPVVATAVTPGGPAAPAPAPAPAPTPAPTPATNAPKATPAVSTPTAAPATDAAVVESKQAKQAALIAEKQRRLAEREQLLLQKAQEKAARELAKAEQIKRKEEERKEALRKAMQEANEKGTTDAPHIHVQLLTAELERVKSELRAAMEEKKVADAPCGKALMWGRFVRDVTIPDGTQMQPNETFTKTWRFRNELDRPWPVGTRLLFVGKNSDRLGAPDEVLIAQSLKPHEEIDISVPLVAPNAPGRYTAYFRLAGPEGKKFGQRVWVMISVVGAGSDEDDGNEPQPSPEQVAHWKAQLDVLAQMGFLNNAVNIRLLRRFNGSLEEAVVRLMKRTAKRNKLAQLHIAKAAAVASAQPAAAVVPSTILPAGPVPIPVPTATPLPAIASAALPGNPNATKPPSAHVDP